MLAQHLVTRLIPEGPIIIGVDDTIERRWGAQITARGFTALPSVPAMVISSRQAACAGSVSWCLFLCRGFKVLNLCLS